MLAKRGTLQALQEPQYVFKEVPRTKRDLSDSIVLAVDNRQVWIESLAEILLLCNEAANRRKVSYYVPPSARGKPLALEYLADRFDLDDPLTGFMIRTADEGWLQGFITITTFTTWQRWFRWDSLIPDAGVVDEHIDLEEDEELKLWLKKRKRDLDGNLAIELQSQIFDGDYSTNGVIWPRIAEVTLLGGLGCGSLLMNKIIYDLEASSSQYDYIVLQATENAVEFYERFGFVRVGAVARYEEIVTEENEDESTEDEEESESSGSEYQNSDEEDGSEGEGTDDDDEEDSTSDEEDDSESSEDEEEGDENSESDDDDDPQGGGKRRKRKRGNEVKRKDSKKLKVDNDPDDGLTERERRALRRNKLVVSQEKKNSGEQNETEEDQDGVSDRNNTGVEKTTGKAASRGEESTVLSSNFFWYTAKSDETPIMIARKFGLRAFDILFFNKQTVPGLTASAKLYGGTKLRVPKIPDVKKLKAEAEARAKQHKQSLVPGDTSDSNAAWYVALDDEGPREIAKKLDVNVKELISTNCSKLDGLNIYSRLVEGTKLRIPGRAIAGEGAEEQNAPPLVAYRHWTFSNDSVDTTCVSYMMVRKLKKRRAPKRNSKGVYEDVPFTEEKKAALLFERKLRMEAPQVKETRFYRYKQDERRKKQAEEAQRIKLEEIEEARRRALPKIPIRVKLKMKGLQGHRLIGPLVANASSGEGKKDFAVYLNNTGAVGFLRADLEKPLMKPVPPEPEKPKRNLSGYMFYSNSQRELLVKKHPELPITGISKIIGQQWAVMSDEEKAPYQEKSRIAKISYLKKQAHYQEKLRVYERAVNLREKLRLKHHGPTQEELEEMSKKNGIKSKAGKHDHKRLFNKVVKVTKNEHGWKYYFVLTYIPDLQWVHLAPMHQYGIFTTQKRGVAMGRPRWMLAPEGKACELDISASRCVPVRNRVMRNCPNADKEEWDIFEENGYSQLGDTMYKSVFDSLRMNILVLKPTEDCSNDDKAAAPASSNGFLESDTEKSSSKPPNALDMSLTEAAETL